MNRLGPRVPPVAVPADRGWLLSLLGGWLSFAASRAFPPFRSWTEVGDLPSGLAGAATLAGVARGLIYCGLYWPPISLCGRVSTGRLIVPGYDRVLIPPAAMAAIGFVLPRLLRLSGASPPVTAGLTVAAVVAVGLNAGPTLRRWRLTGHHRMFAGADPNRTASNRQRAKLAQG